MEKDVKTAAFVILEKYLDATDENINKEQIVNAMIEYAELRLSKERRVAESSNEHSGLNKPVVIKSVCDEPIFDRDGFCMRCGIYKTEHCSQTVL